MDLQEIDNIEKAFDTLQEIRPIVLIIERAMMRVHFKDEGSIYEILKEECDKMLKHIELHGAV